jgi:hypothetical protein
LVVLLTLMLLGLHSQPFTFFKIYDWTQKARAFFTGKPSQPIVI